MKLKAGVLGAGHLGKIHLKLLQQSDKYELAGFFDPDASNGKKVESEFGYKFFSSLEALIDAVDVVDIVTHTLSHYTYTIKAISKETTVQQTPKIIVYFLASIRKHS